MNITVTLTEATPTTLYHVTMRRHLPQILQQGLRANRTPTFTSGIYPTYTKGKIFLTSKEGVNYWEERTENAEEHEYDDPKGTAILAVDVSGLDLRPDDVGEQDAKAPAFFVTDPIPPDRLDVERESPAEPWEDDE